MELRLCSTAHQDLATQLSSDVMTILARHLFSQRRVFMALGQVVVDSLRIGDERVASSVPGAEVRARIAPPSEALIADYLESVGGSQHAYGGTIPAHLFPQWSFPPLVKSLLGARYPLTRALNVGCRLQMNAPLSTRHQLDIRAQLLEVRDDGRRAVLHARVTTGQDARADALVADLYAVVPSRRKRQPNAAGAKSERERPGIPVGAEALERFTLERRAGLRFALVTGDVNPIHWLGPYARAAGFTGPVLHGFALLARSFEALVRARFQGLPARLQAIDVRFTRPLPLPAEVTLYAERDQLFVGAAPKAPAYMTGTFSSR